VEQQFFDEEILPLAEPEGLIPGLIAEGGEETGAGA
jgi:hypothetical protein